MKKAKPSTLPAETIARYEKLVATQRGLERKGAAMPYTSVNGHMFSFLTPEGVLALRLPKPALEAFLEQHQTTRVEQHGAVLQEYAAVPAALWAKPAQLAKVFAQSVEYARSLQPKKPKKQRPISPRRAGRDPATSPSRSAAARPASGRRSRSP